MDKQSDNTIRNDEHSSASKIEAIEAEVRKLPKEQVLQLHDWLANMLEDEAELNAEFVACIERGEADIKQGHIRTRRT